MIRICAGDPGPWLRQYTGKKPLFACILSFTETGLIPGISAAGTTPQARRYTAIADAEFLAADRPTSRSQPRSPTHPLPPLKAGISPAFITRAVLTQQNIPFQLLSTGLPEALDAEHIALPQVMAKSVHTAQAMSLSQVQSLFESGLYWGEQLAQRCLGSYLIVGECVVGGTTTAQAVLTALGYSVAGRMSSSHANSNHQQKQHLVHQGLRRWHEQGDGAKPLTPLQTALSAIAACGDPMQPVAAGMALAASQQVGVLLAGGSQMLAVYALAKALAKALPTERVSPNLFSSPYLWQTQRVVVGTTRWVIEDSSACTQAIAQDLGAPYLASEINFSQSPYFQLRAYEQGFVKEGVGAGGCAIAAHLYKGWSNSQLRHAVESELRQSL
jgi:uncharacterized protein (TIGR00303 family)